MHRLEEESNQRSALSVDRDDAILSLQVSLYNLFKYKLSKNYPAHSDFRLSHYSP